MSYVSTKVSAIVSAAVAALAVLVTSGMINSSCYIFMYQPELPEGAEQLYK